MNSWSVSSSTRQISSRKVQLKQTLFPWNTDAVNATNKAIVSVIAPETRTNLPSVPLLSHRWGSSMIIDDEPGNETAHAEAHVAVRDILAPQGIYITPVALVNLKRIFYLWFSSTTESNQIDWSTGCRSEDSHSNQVWGKTSHKLYVNVSNVFIYMHMHSLAVLYR